jgi:hypothetical protein
VYSPAVGAAAVVGGIAASRAAIYFLTSLSYVGGCNGGHSAGGVVAYYVGVAYVVGEEIG